MLLRSFCFWLLAGPCLSVRLFAHDPGLSSARISAAANNVELRLTFAAGDLLAAFAPASNASQTPDQSATALRNALTRDATLLAQIYSNGELQRPTAFLVSTSDDDRKEAVVSITWASVPGGVIRLEVPVLKKLPFGHRMVLTLGDSPDIAALLDARHATWEFSSTLAAALPPADVPTGSGAVESKTVGRGWPAFLILGVEHILAGVDHLAFLFALLLVAVRRRDIFAIVTAFTVAHSLTLAAAATGWVSLSPRIVEPLIALSVVYVGFENVYFGRRALPHRVALVFCFGLVHGLGFATALAEQLPAAETGIGVLAPLLAFNFGVELGQLGVAACLVPLIAWVRSRPRLAERLQPAFSLAIAAGGLAWLWQRV